MDFQAMESEARKKGYTFRKSAASKPGFILIERSEASAKEQGIELKYMSKGVQAVTKCIVDRPDEAVKIRSIMWDGMSICDSSILPSDCSEFMYLRNHMFKSCAFVGEVVQYLKDTYGDDYYTATRKDYFDNDIKVSDIRLICCDDSIKFLKFKQYMGETSQEVYEFYDKWMKKFDYKFAIVKTAHSSRYGNYQRMSYQGVSSLPCYNIKDCEDIAKSSIQYCNAMKTDNNKFIDYLIATATNHNINNVLIELEKKNPEFVHSRFFCKKKAETISSLKRDKLMLGKLMQTNSENMTICGNPYALLMYAAEEKTGLDSWKKDPCFKVSNDCRRIQCYTTRWNNGTQLGGYRNPQNSMNNYGYYVNKYSKKMKTYFPQLGQNVVVIDMRSNNQARLNGHDMDTDGIFLTSQKTIVKYAKKCIKDYPTIINNVPVVDDLSEIEQEKFRGISYKNDMNSYAIADNAISLYQIGIGWSANVSALALAYYMDEFSRSKGQSRNTDLEDVFIITAVLSQIYIDSAKRTFAIDCNKEMNRLVNLQCMKREKKYPRYFAEIQRRKNKITDDDSKNKKKQKREFLDKLPEMTMLECQCPMQIIADILDKKIENMTGTTKTVQTSKGNSIQITKFLTQDYDKKGIIRSTVTRLQRIIAEYGYEMGKLNSACEEYADRAYDITDVYMKKIKEYGISRDTMQKIIRDAANKYSKVLSYTLIAMYNYDREKFLSIFSSKKP